MALAAGPALAKDGWSKAWESESRFVREGADGDEEDDDDEEEGRSMGEDGTDLPGVFGVMTTFCPSETTTGRTGTLMFVKAHTTSNLFMLMKAS